jgi:flagellar export protein FliJ
LLVCFKVLAATVAIDGKLHSLVSHPLNSRDATSMTKSTGNQVAKRIMGPKQKFAADALAAAQQNLQTQQLKLQQLLTYKQNFVNEFLNSSVNGTSEGAIKEYETNLAKIDRDIELKKSSIIRGEKLCETRRREWVMCSKKIKTVENLHHRQNHQDSHS